MTSAKWDKKVSEAVIAGIGVIFVFECFSSQFLV